MVKIDLITGFLGAGKTTFLLGYAKYLMRQGMKIGILEYDYGAINVDMLLLNQLRGDRCELEMVAAACDEDCLKRRFRTKLISMAMSGYDRVIVEPLTNSLLPSWTWDSPFSILSLRTVSANRVFMYIPPFIPSILTRRAPKIKPKEKTGSDILEAPLERHCKIWDNCGGSWKNSCFTRRLQG